MYPDLSYFFHDVFGTAPDNWLAIFKTFGLFLALAFLVAGYLVFIQLRQLEKAGHLQPQLQKVTLGEAAKPSELLSSGFFGTVLVAKIAYGYAHIEDVQADAVSVLFSAKGNWLLGLLGGAAFAGWRYYEKKKEQLPKPKVETIKVFPSERTGDMIIMAAIGGIVGAKVFAIIEELDRFWADPIGMFFSGSGLAIYGGLIGGFLTVYWYVRKYGIPVRVMMDIAAPALILAYGVGRLGCHFSGDGDWGVENLSAKPGWLAWLPDNLWAYSYPHNVNNDGVAVAEWQGQYNYYHRLEPAVYPTPIYETFLTVVIFAILWALRSRIRIAGILFFIYMILNGIERYAIEIIRVNTRYAWFFDLTQAQIIALLFILTGIVGWVWLWRDAKGKAAKA